MPRFVVRSAIPMLIISAVLAGCESDPADVPRTETSVPIAELRAAPERVETQGVVVRGDGFAWRSYMRIVPIDTSMAAAIRIGVEEGDLPSVSVERIWVLRLVGLAAVAAWEDEVPTSRSPDEPFIDGVIRAGPFWPVGSTVQVVARIRTSDGPKLIRTAPTRVQRVD